MEWVESSGIEKDVILFIGKKEKNISEIAESLEKGMNTIGKYIERMESQKTVIRTQDYLNGARKSNISINFERVKINRADIFYLRYFVITFFSFILTSLITFLSKKITFFIGGFLEIIFTLIYMSYMVFIEKDKISVEKLVKSKTRKKQKEVKTKEKIEKI